jgi:uncharacterized membrane protein
MYVAMCLAAIIIGYVAAATFVYMHPNTATVTQITLTRTLDGTVLADGEVIDWGTVEPGKTYTYSLAVTNTGNVDVNVTLTHNAPSDWQLNWAGNKTILSPAQSVYGDLVLTVSSSATPGAVYDWNCYVTATEA